MLFSCGFLASQGTMAQRQSRFEDLTSEQQRLLERLLNRIAERRGGSVRTEELIAVPASNRNVLAVYVNLYHDDGPSELIICALGTDRLWGGCNVRDAISDEIESPLPRPQER